MGYEFGKLFVYPAARFALGAVSTIGGSYLVSRIGEKQVAETRLERLEKIVEKLATEQEAAGKKK
ncbi:MAG: hypothetical protein MJE63_16395 [Proteobacteria bacterium]|nr:hypothetical protein [Pseudomonadota bacterium]